MERGAAYLFGGIAFFGAAVVSARCFEVVSAAIMGGNGGTGRLGGGKWREKGGAGQNLEGSLYFLADRRGPHCFLASAGAPDRPPGSWVRPGGAD
jgi:hypothetical protein